MKGRYVIERVIREITIVELDAPSIEEGRAWALQRARITGQVDWDGPEKSLVVLSEEEIPA